MNGRTKKLLEDFRRAAGATASWKQTKRYYNSLSAIDKARFCKQMEDALAEPIGLAWQAAQQMKIKENMNVTVPTTPTGSRDREQGN